MYRQGASTLLFLYVSTLIIATIPGRVLLYDTDNNEYIEKFDCIYYTYNDGEEISYCQRPGESMQLNRTSAQCENGGEKRHFLELLDQDIQPSEILRWISSVEMADLYATVFYDRSLLAENDTRFVCNCTQYGTFGKYCEYQFTHRTNAFSKAILNQFDEKRTGDFWNTQRYGSILCYTTLPCESSPLCLDWREICDGVQRCLNGMDEENRDKLEFNECEDDEYRCSNGMCIAEEFWLDGDVDCMDWSDELYLGMEDECPFAPKSIECDEHLCIRGMYSCGDGQCILWGARMAFQRFNIPFGECFTKRNLNYMCEVSPYRPAWTLESGLCWPDENYDDLRYPPWDMMNTSNLTEADKCQYLFRCLLSEGVERDCPCRLQRCVQMMMDLCSKPSRVIFYPPPGLINSNVFVAYDYTKFLSNQNFHFFGVYGSLKCRGFFFRTHRFHPLDTSLLIIMQHLINHGLCTINDPAYGDRDFSSPLQNDKFCWNDSLTFNGRPYAVNPNICLRVGECISQYRIRDGTYDCLGGDDEAVVLERSYCTGNVGRQRFQCFNKEHKCLTIERLRTYVIDCSNSYDESLHGIGISSEDQVQCVKGHMTNCHQLKDYIQQSSIGNLKNQSDTADYSPSSSTSRIPFAWYCDTFWDLEGDVDEMNSSCLHWVCRNNEYQCRTGHCIPLRWVCDGEWDCPDASDEEAIVLMRNQSVHNFQLQNLSSLIQQCHALYLKPPFSNICNTTFELGCLRSHAANPLDIHSHRPCINLTQIGDGIEDCYNQYDEKNTFKVNFFAKTTWGFQFQCADDYRTYRDVCSNGKVNCTDIVCAKYRDKVGVCSDINDFICFEDNRCRKNARCNKVVDCSFGEDEYWCPQSSAINIDAYRQSKKRSLRSIKQVIDWMPFVPEETTSSTSRTLFKLISDARKDQHVTSHSYRCNRGIAVIRINETYCLCPPAYYGRWCQFFSDRITLIAHLDRTTLPKSLTNVTLKIKAHLTFVGQLIDYHEFHAMPTFENGNVIKHRFYLLYSRSLSMLAHKRWRYFNRTDVVNNHPYSVQLDVFALGANATIHELGSWHYPIYFDYLPSFRLAVRLRFPVLFKNITHDRCAQNDCNGNSTCLPVLNHNHSHYCSCKRGYYGTNCNLYDSHCDSYCLTQAFCRPIDLQVGRKQHCICPLGHFGPRCNLKYDGCYSSPCANNGTCLATYDRSDEKPYACRCSSLFYGEQCEHEKASVRVHFNHTKTTPVRAAVVQLFALTDSLTIRYQAVFHGLPSTITYYDPDTVAPFLGILKTYADVSHPQYAIIYLRTKQTIINVTSSPYDCPPSASPLFRYHHICRNQTERLCFYDEAFLCICQRDHYRVDCFLYDTQLDQCDKCLSAAKCLQGNLKDADDVICLCPSCHQGPRCEFSMQAFGITLDSLLVECSRKVKIMYASIVCLLVIIGLFNNYCSFVTFKRPTPRKFAVGNYLLIVSCFNKIVLFCLFFKFMQMPAEIIDHISCKTFSYGLSVMTRSTYWLTTWITIDRLLLILFPTSSTRLSPRKAIGISVLTLIILAAMHVHEIVYYTVVHHRSTASPVCVTNFHTHLVATYNRISTVLHYLLPFAFQVVCITCLIVLASHSRVKTAGQNETFRQVLKKQFSTQKEHYVTPTIIILSAMPQTILTFSFACTPLRYWQRHILLSAYLLSYLPQLLGFILNVLPSTIYKKEFRSTRFGLAVLQRIENTMKK
ncbi:unnamed protein product [Adineta ricciae]|uniref:Uncharacterized protein n=1 Tax=Adineta ricciae TaxID=249248 RepID=A0A815REW5_ADIRI|nr:unnamed protein product [Adineta ricciae]CAF1476275.1 unnamed protein product [Adineta ricciae]